MSNHRKAASDRLAHIRAYLEKKNKSELVALLLELVPGDWSVQRAHQLAEQIESRIHLTLPSIAVFTHVEPLEDPLSRQDSTLEKE